MDATLVIGVLGAGLLLAAFIANEFDWLEEKTYLFQGMNFAGGALLVWYSYLIVSWPFVALESVWALASLRGMWLLAKEGKKE
jgi:hypothetical protein